MSLLMSLLQLQSDSKLQWASVEYGVLYNAALVKLRPHAHLYGMYIAYFHYCIVCSLCHGKMRSDAESKAVLPYHLIFLMENRTCTSPRFHSRK